MRRSLAVLLSVIAIAALGACGGGDDDPPPVTVTTEATTTTTIEQGDAQGIACLNLATRGLNLLNDYRQDQRGVAGADEAYYAAEAEVLRAEHASLGCPGDLLRGFP